MLGQHAHVCCTVVLCSAVQMGCVSAAASAHKLGQGYWQFCSGHACSAQRVGPCIRASTGLPAAAQACAPCAQAAGWQALRSDRHAKACFSSSALQGQRSEVTPMQRSQHICHCSTANRSPWQTPGAGRRAQRMCAGQVHFSMQAVSATPQRTLLQLFSTAALVHA